MLRYALLAAALGLGCSAEFLPASVVVNERIIAVTANPPEAVPGADVTLTPLVVSPAGELDAADVLWWRCPDGDSDALGDFVQCSAADDRIDHGRASSYVDTVPLDLFGAAPAPGEPPFGSDKLLGALLGYWRVVGLTLEAGDRHVDAFKRIPVYLPIHLGDVDPRLAAVDTHVDAHGDNLGANINPTLSAVSVHADAVDGATTTTLTSGGTYFLQPIFDDASLQPYLSLKVDLAGLDVSDPESIKRIPLEELLRRFQKVQRCEVPTFSWFVTHGRVRRDTTLDEGVITRVYDAAGVSCPAVEGDVRAPEVEYTAPTGDEDDPLPADGLVHGWVVMRDGRGGSAVRSFDLTLE
jgi:hypothetical protein